MEEIYKEQSDHSKKLTFFAIVAAALIIWGSFYFFYRFSGAADFVVEVPNYDLAAGEVQVIEGAEDHLPLTHALFLGRIVKKPSINKDTEGAEVVVDFERADGEKVRARVILGLQDKTILTFIPEGGAIIPGVEQEWLGRPISEILPLLRAKDPIYVRLNVDEVSEAVFQDVRCSGNEDCIKYLYKARESFDNNNQLLQAVRGQIEAGGELQAESVSGLIIYQK